MDNIEINKLAYKYKMILISQRCKSHAMVREIEIVVNDYILGNGYCNTFKTELYQNHSGEYCELLQIIANDLNLYPKLNINMGDETNVN